MEIIQYTAEQFINSSEPYRFLLSITDPFERQQMQHQLANMAKQVGVTGFLKLWNTFLKSQGVHKPRFETQNLTEFDSLPQELTQQMNCGEFYAGEDGIKVYDRDKLITVCPHPILITRRFSNVITGEMKAELAYRRSYEKRWRKLIVDMDYIYNAKKMIELTKNGIAVTSKMAPYLVDYLSQLETSNDDMLQLNRSISHLGWHSENGQIEFIPYSKDCEFDGEGELRTVYRNITRKGSYEKWLEAAKKIRNSEFAPPKIMLVASFASILLPIVKGLPFFVHLYGKTGTGKSVMLKMAASVWGNPEHYMVSFDSTQVGKDELCAMLYNMPLCMDELQIIKNSRYDNKENIIYKLTEGVGRTRGAKAGGIQTVKRWKNTILTTGEHTILDNTAGGGAINRVIELSIYRTKLTEDLKGLHDTICDNYGHAGKAFVEAVSAEGIPERIRTYFDIYANDFRAQTVTDKQCISAALLVACDKILGELIFDDTGSFSVEDMLPYLVKERDLQQDKEAYYKLMSWVASNAGKFIETTDMREKWGKIIPKADGRYVFIGSQFFDQFMQENGYDRRNFLQWCRDEGIIIQNPGRNTCTQKIYGVTMRGVMLNMEYAGYEEVSLKELAFNEK